MKQRDLDLIKLELAAQRLKAMAHPQRIAIINLLRLKKKLTVTQIYKKLKLDQAVTSHHLLLLKNKGLLISTRVGKNIFYEIKHCEISKIIECINSCNEE